MADAADGDFIKTGGNGSQPLPTEGDFVPAPSFFDSVSNAAPGKVYHAITTGASDAWGQGPVIPQDIEDSLKKAGWFDDYKDGKANLLKQFNESITRPLVYSGYLIQRGLGAGLQGAATGAHEAITQAGGSEELARVPGELLSYETSRGDILADRVPERLPPTREVTTEQAARVGTLTPGGEKAYFNTHETPIAGQDLAESLATRNDETATPADLPVQPDVHAIARQLAPETFQEYDALSTRRDMFRSQLSELGEIRPQTQFAIDTQNRINTILSKVNGVEDRLTNAAQARLDAARDDLDTALSHDTPQMANIRKQMMDLDYRMRDLAPDVAAAYRMASANLPEQEALPTHEEPQPQEQRPPQVIPAAQAEEAATAPPNVAGTPLGAAPQSPVANIASDVQRKLVEAGRPAEEADAAAQIVAAHYQARAQRFGGQLGTAEELYAREAPNIRGAGQRAKHLEFAQGRTLDQRVEEPPVPEGHTRLYRGETTKEGGANLPEWLKDRVKTDPKLKASLEANGRWFSASRKEAEYYNSSFGHKDGRISYVDVPTKDVEKYNARNNEETSQHASHGRENPEYFLPKDVASSRKALFAEEPGATDAQGNALPQTIIPGAEGSVKQLAAAREAAGHGKIAAKKAQKEAGPLFTPGEGAEGGNQGSLFQAKRGSITLGEARNTIKLFKSANASTFMHETAHDWLEEMMRDAQDARAPDDLRRDADTVRKYVNAKADGSIPTRGHEKFARSFERYLMEGVAPSRELAGVFAKFKDWLTQIYQTVQKLKAPITDDIRAVFDRLLAANPERTVIAPERASSASSMADIHEAEAEATPPHQAAAVADNMRSEIERVAKREVPEVHAELTRGNERVAAENEGSTGRGHEAGSAIGPTENAGRSGAQPESGNAPAKKGAQSRAGAYNVIPREPTRLADFIRKAGGLRDDGGDIATVMGTGSKTGTKGLIRKDGIDPDTLAHRAWDAGYFPELQERPMVNDLLEKLSEDLTGNSQYSDLDHDAVMAFHDALQHNAEVDRLANELGLDAKQMTKAEFWSRVSEHMSIEDMGRINEEMSVASEAEFQEAERNAQEWMEAHDGWEPDGFYEGQGSRTLEDLERERDAEDASRDARQGPSGPAPSRLTPADEDGVQGRSGQGGTGARDAGRNDDEGAKGGFSGPDADAKRRSYIEEYLKNINVSSDANALIRRLASHTMDFNDARFGDAAYTLYHQIKAANALVEVTAEKAADAFRRWDASDSEADSLAYTEATQRALVANNTRAQLRAGWGYAGHALQKVDRIAKSENYLAFIKRTTGKTPEELRQEGRLLYQLDTADQKVNFLEQSRTSALQRLKSGTLSYFINNLISGPITHAGYSIGNTVWAITKAIPTTAVAATIDSIRGADAGSRIYYGEIPAQIYGAVRGARDAIPAAWKAAKTGVPFMKGAEELDNLQGDLGVYQPLTREQQIFGQSGPVLKTAGYVLETPSRVVTAIHTMFYSMGYEQEIARRAYRDAMDKGLDGNAFSTHVARFTEKPPVEDIEAAHNEALKMVLMQRPAYDSFTGGLSRLTNKYFLAKILMPFMQIGSNILREGLVEHSPLGIASQAVRDNLSGKNGDVARSTQYAKIMVGTSAATAVIGLTAEGIVTGGGPSDRGKRDTLMRTGWKPYSIRIGENYVPYRKYLGPLGPLLAGASDMYEIGHTAHEDGFTKAAAATVFGLSEVVADETWMSGLSNFIDAARNWDQNGTRYLRNMAADFIPFSVGMKQMATQIDPYVRIQNDTIEALKSHIPFASTDLTPRRDVWGEPIISHTSLGPSQAVPDRVDDELIRLNKYYPANAKKSIMGVPLTEGQYDDYVRISGRYSKMQLLHDMNSDYWASADDETKIAMVKADVEAGREQARDAIMGSDPTIWQRATMLKMQQQGRYSSP